MVDCLLLYAPSITYTTKVKILRSMFHSEMFEIEAMCDNTICLYLWNVDKTKIWQAITDLESTNVFTLHGDGQCSRSAFLQAESLLVSRLELEDIK